MPYKLSIEPKPAYLHAIVTGDNTREDVAAYLASLLRECVARGCFRVLVEERLEGPRLDTPTVMAIVVEASVQAAGRMEAVAYVDATGQSELMEFAEMVATNRGVPVAVFPTLAAAEKWLLEKAGGGT